MVELIHMGFDFYNVTFIRGFTSMLTVLCTKTIPLWVLPNSPKRTTVCIMRFIITELTNEQHPCKRVRFDEDGAWEKSIDFTNLILDDFNIYMETTRRDESWLNINN